MKPFYTETQVRWSDLDANRHLANASYMNFTSFARLSFLSHHGVTMNHLEKWNIGPAVLREEFSFFKEAHDQQQIIITVEVSGVSEKGDIFEFLHNLYLKENGTHLAFSRVLGVWFSMDARKITAPPTELVTCLQNGINPETVRTLSLQDLKTLPVKPQNVDIKSLLGI